jgi:hypothetical protein
MGTLRWSRRNLSRLNAAGGDCWAGWQVEAADWLAASVALADWCVPSEDAAVAVGAHPSSHVSESMPLVPWCRFRQMGQWQ